MKKRVRKPSAGCSAGFPLAPECSKVRYAFAALSEASAQRDLIMDEPDTAQRAVMLGLMLPDVVEALAVLTRVFARDSARAQRDARMVGAAEARKALLAELKDAKAEAANQEVHS